MKILNWIPALTLSGLMASTALAAPNVIIGDDSINIGNAATIDLTFQADGVVAGLDFTFSFDDAQFTATPSCVASLPTTGAAASVVCSVVGNTVKVLVSAPLAFPVPTILTGDQSLGTISFQSAVAVPVASYPLAITEENYFDINAVGVTPTASTDGTITVNAGPQPFFNTTPANVSLSGQISTTLETNVVVDNNGGEAGSSLDYTCTETSDPDNKFTISGETAKVIGTTETGTIAVACDSSVIGSWSGNVECTHNGSNTSPMNVPLACTVTAGPEPAYTGVAAGLAMVATEQGDPDPTGSVAITNTGDATTTLTGTCTLTGPDAQITVSNGAFSVAEGAAAHSVAVSCDASAEGDYSNTLSCTHNGTNTASPATYPVSCDVGPPGPAVYASTPADGAVIDMTTADVPVGAVVPDQVLTITNDAAEANDRDLALMGCAWAGDAAITATAPTTPVAAQASTSVTFSCDTAAVGAWTGTYSCPHDLDGDGTADSTATYTVNCGVRVAASDILEAPVSGTALSMVVPIGGTAQASVNFSEILDEGVDATIDACSFGTADFSVVTTIPATVTAGSTVTVNVEGTDPGNGTLIFNDTLTCTYTDSDSAPGTASWPITMTVSTAVPIPTLSVWGLMLMILTLVGLGGMVMRRKVES